MKIIIALLFTVFSVTLWAQNSKDATFILHEVKAKETLYSLSRSYNISINRIVVLNPTVDQGLSIGQKIKIPQSQISIHEKTTEIIHTVQAQETIYSISKKYGITITDIKKWNKKSDNSLAIGEKIVIRQSKIVDNKTNAQPINTKGKKIHIVKSKETLYGISRLYAITSEDLMHWNRLKNNDLDIGQTLIVGVEYEKDEEADNDETKKAEQPTAKEDIKIVSIEEKEPLKSIEVFEDDKPRKVKNASGFDEIVQTGLAELIEGTSESRKYLALHTTARVGTIMKVRNEMNNQMVFVRVIGKIPATGDNQKILIKLSKAAYERLGALDKRFRVEVSYMP